MLMQRVCVLSIFEGLLCAGLDYVSSFSVYIDSKSNIYYIYKL